MKFTSDMNKEKNKKKTIHKISQGEKNEIKWMENFKKQKSAV